MSVGPKHESYESDLLNRAFDFTGRASRSEFLYLNLLLALVSFVLLTAIGLIESISLNLRQTDRHLSLTLWFALIVVGGFWLLSLIPVYAITVRRMHDFNLSGWWLIAVVAVIFAVTNGGDGAYLLWFMFDLIILLIPGTAGVNRFGEYPAIHIWWSDTVFGRFMHLPRLKKILLTTLTVASVYFAFFIPIEGKRPVDLGNGQTRYSLIDHRNNGVWELSFPDEMEVFRPEAYYRGWPSLGGRDSGYHVNQTLRIRLRLPDLRMQDQESEAISPDTIEVVLSARAAVRDESMLHFGMRDNCADGLQLGPGVFERTDIAVEDARPLYERLAWRDETFDEFYDRRFRGRCDGSIVLYDEDANLVGQGNCWDSLPVQCRFSVWFSMKRDATLRFHQSQAPHLQEMYEHLEQYLKEATVEVSDNHSDNS